MAVFCHGTFEHVLIKRVMLPERRGYSSKQERSPVRARVNAISELLKRQRL